MKKLRILLPALAFIFAIGTAFSSALAIVNAGEAFNPLSTPALQCQSAQTTVLYVCDDTLKTGIRCQVLFSEPGSVAQMLS